jgi:hypothetical protein
MRHFEIVLEAALKTKADWDAPISIDRQNKITWKFYEQAGKRGPKNIDEVKKYLKDEGFTGEIYKYLYGVFEDWVRKNSKKLLSGSSDQLDIILKLLKLANVSSDNINRLTRFYRSNRSLTDSHPVSPDDEECLRQLYNGERLMAEVNVWRIKVRPEYVIVPKKSGKSYDLPGLRYVVTRDNIPLAQETIESHKSSELMGTDGSTLKNDLLRPLGFGYSLDDILWYVAHFHPDVRDMIGTAANL